LLGVRSNDQLKPPTWNDLGRVEREGYHIDKLVLRTDTSVLPALTFHPPEPRAGAYLYLHEEGKLVDGAPGGEIETLVKEGYVVVAVDLRCCGELASDKPDKSLGQWKTYYVAYLLGKPLVGLQVEDVLAAAHFVAYYETKNPREVHVVGVGQAGLAALHAAALRPELFTSLTLRDVPRDWSSVVQQTAPAGQLTGTVHGALAVYDLPDLVRLAGGDKVRYVEPDGGAEN
jgi:pimeloyl-ACP methyl ester carboxylesterase